MTAAKAPRVRSNRASPAPQHPQAPSPRPAPPIQDFSHPSPLARFEGLRPGGDRRSARGASGISARGRGPETQRKRCIVQATPRATPTKHRRRCERLKRSLMQAAGEETGSQNALGPEHRALGRLRTPAPPPLLIRFPGPPRESALQALGRQGAAQCRFGSSKRPKKKPESGASRVCEPSSATRRLVPL